MFFYGLASMAFFFSPSAKAQLPLVLNSYAKVIDFPGCIPCFTSCNQVQVDDPSGFTVGDMALLIQMKGADISWEHDPAFGTITTYGSAGFHEVLQIASINAATKTIEFSSAIAGNYDVAGKVQLIKQFYNPSGYTVPASGITCAPWNGDTGGVLFMEINGPLSLSGDIDVTGKGFRGAENPNSNIDTVVCGTGGPQGNVFANGIYYLDYAFMQWAGRKGEGIAEFRNPAYELGRGPLANGGGGGLNHNSGGGGGGNMGSGGLGGDPYVGISNVTCGVTANGMGGKVLDRMGGLRMFLGGGGGAGHENNNNGNSGGNGGGIIIIKANSIEGNGHKIISDGYIGFNYAGINGGPGGNDGGGGGGAGGSIKIDCNDFGTTPLVLQARGGDGGSLTVAPSDAHGSGGGGGGGLICFSASTINNPLVTVVSTGGLAGTMNDSLFTNGATDGGAGLTAFSCSSVSSVPPSQIPFTLGADKIICSDPAVTLDTRLPNSSYTFAWYYNGTLINEATDSAYVLNLPGKYVVKVTAPFCTATDTIQITKKGAELPVNQTFCASAGPVPVTFSISNTEADANYGWYTAATGGSFLGLGASYTIPALDKDTTLFVADTNKITTTIGPDGSAGAQVYYVGGPNSSDITLQEHHRRFDVFSPMALKSVQVLPALNTGGCGHNTSFTRSITITVYQNGIATPFSATGTVQCGVLSAVMLNFNLPIGNNYELRVEGIDNGQLMMNDQHIAYSVPDVLTITSNYAKSGVFFNWEIEYGVTCARIPVWAKASCPLPVTIINFNGKHAATYNHLYWTTADEADMEGYVIQRSEDGIDFTDLALIPAAASGSYQFRDHTLQAKGYYYRLKVPEKNGTLSFSTIIYISSGADQSFSVYPNPASNELTVHFQKLTGDFYFTIWDITGKKVAYKEGALAQNIDSVVLNISHLAPGIYFINCYSSSGEFQSVKFEVRQ